MIFMILSALPPTHTLPPRPCTVITAPTLYLHLLLLFSPQIFAPPCLSPLLLVLSPTLLSPVFHPPPPPPPSPTALPPIPILINLYPCSLSSPPFPGLESRLPPSSIFLLLLGIILIFLSLIYPIFSPSFHFLLCPPNPPLRSA